MPLTKRTSDSKHDKIPLKLHGGAGVLRTWSWPGETTKGSRAGTHIPWDQAGCGDQGALLIRQAAKTFPSFPQQCIQDKDSIFENKQESPNNGREK